MSAWLIVVAVWIPGCETFEIVDGDDDLSGSAILTSAAGAALSIGTTAFLTEHDHEGHAIVDRRELALAIARGHGPFVRDLAAWLALPEALVPELGATLRAARPVLEPALSKPISERSFATLLGVALCRSPTLRYHAWKRYHCASLAPLGS